MRVVEACLVAAVTATVGFLMMFTINDCKPLGQDPTKYPTQVCIKFTQFVKNLTISNGSHHRLQTLFPNSWRFL